MAKKQAKVRKIVFGPWFWCEICAILRQLSRSGDFRFALLSVFSEVSYSFVFGISIFGSLQSVYSGIWSCTLLESVLFGEWSKNVIRC